MTQATANVEIRWLTQKEGGRTQPFVGAQYAATARFVGEDNYFSIVVRFPTQQQANPPEGKLRLLNPDLHEIQTRIIPGCRLEIAEGSRTVAHCRVVSLEKEAPATLNVGK